MNNLFEALMLLSFGAAWPAAIYRSWTSRQTGGKSLLFLYIVLFGYACGIVNRLLQGANFVLAIYLLDVGLVATDICIYYRNQKLERRAALKP
jgi:hypothetical protein